MISRVSGFLIFIGFMMVFGGVGGIETEGPLFENTIIAIVGCAIMYVGVNLLPSKKPY